MAKKAVKKKAAAKKSAASKKTATKKSTKAKKTGSPASPPSTPTSSPASASDDAALIPPPGGAAVRMYRIGHGDCFLIAFASENPERPAYVLIDCGYKPGSPEKLTTPTDVQAIGQHIIKTTGGFVDVAVVTHEHQDHVNGLKPENFPGLKVGKVWFAWTESPDDDVAKALRKKFHDRLLGLIDARDGLAANAVADIDEFLEFELGEEPRNYRGLKPAAAGAKDPARSPNKVAMKFLRDCGTGDPDYLYPHGKARAVPAAKSARAFVLGPPRDVDKIDDLDPVGDEDFGQGMGAAAGGGKGSQFKTSPFSRRHAIPLDRVFTNPETKDFFRQYYGNKPVAEEDDGKGISDAAEWRRMSANDAADAGALALAMNNATNNASLVLAFELSKGGKVLLFVGDAQAGNWRSWSDDSFDDDGTKVSAEDLLRRTVLYKVGHHGSHNATLRKQGAPGRASLAGMAAAPFAGEFTAMITAVEAWAHIKPKPNWNHPLPAIKKALVEKAGGRVLQTDSGLPANPGGPGEAAWQLFIKRATETPLYFDLKIDP